MGDNSDARVKALKCGKIRATQPQLRLNARHHISRRDRACDEDRPTNGRTFPDHSLASQNHSPRVDRDVVLDGGMPLLPGKGLTVLRRKGPKCNLMEELHVVPDLRGLPYDNSSAVVNEEGRADLRAGVDIDCCPLVGQFAHDSRNQRNLQAEQFVGHAMHKHCFDSRIAQNNLLMALRSRVSSHCSFHVLEKHRPQAAQSGHEGRRPLTSVLLDTTGDLHRAVLALVRQRPCDLIHEERLELTEEHSEMELDVFVSDLKVREQPGEHHFASGGQNQLQLLAVGKVHKVPDTTLFRAHAKGLHRIR
eukprot:RCo042345